LTRGNPLKPLNFLSNLNPTCSTYTGVYAAEGEPSLIGQVRYPLGTRSARLSHLMPGENSNLIALPGLLEHLAAQAGEWGAFNLVGEVDEHTLIFEALRRAGFSIYAWQRIWQFNTAAPNGHPPAGEGKNAWCAPDSADSLHVRLLVQSLVPALVLPIDPAASGRLQGLVYHQDGELQAYANIVYGPLGIWVQPFFRPETSQVPELLLDLLTGLPHRNERPVYLCVRSYQAWLESALEDLSAEVGPRQAVMVKHMAITQKSEALLRLPALEKGRPEPTAPIARVAPPWSPQPRGKQTGIR
jgi:hypothetical protein